MIKKTLYAISVICILSLTIMILLNGLGLVEYRLNKYTSYVSRGLIAILFILFCQAIVDVRRNAQEPDLSQKEVSRKDTSRSNFAVGNQLARPASSTDVAINSSHTNYAPRNPRPIAAKLPQSSKPSALPHLTNRVAQLSKLGNSDIPAQPIRTNPVAQHKPVRPPRLIQ